jgi:hypothetical protein
LRLKLQPEHWKSRVPLINKTLTKKKPSDTKWIIKLRDFICSIVIIKHVIMGKIKKNSKCV